ncbi:MAG: hydrogenase nickel incorporation protein HypB [Coriobacteriales bacterium]|jgi:hydrogenase nickel incorporation protein HypB|nr:hydrogenase nickel incorporation protein HypB [Coriobacteriales bacterium]
MEISLNQKILARNDAKAAQNAELLAKHGIYMLNILASPGAGKTSTILATIRALRQELAIAVIEGDIQSDVDSQAMKAAGIPAVQINTGGICHLESNMVARALAALDQEVGLDRLDLILVENVGNLVCPVDFELGEDAKIVIASVPEGDDKPLKYPGVFQIAQAVVLNKIDTLPVFDFEQAEFTAHVYDLNPATPVFALSATTGAGFKPWLDFLRAAIASK